MRSLVVLSLVSLAAGCTKANSGSVTSSLPNCDAKTKAEVDAAERNLSLRLPFVLQTFLDAHSKNSTDANRVSVENVKLVRDAIVKIRAEEYFLGAHNNDTVQTDFINVGTLRNLVLEKHDFLSDAERLHATEIFVSASEVLARATFSCRK